MKIRTASITFNGELCICKGISHAGEDLVISIQYLDSIIIFPETVKHLSENKEEAVDLILSGIGWNNVKKLNIEVMANVTVTRFGTALVFDNQDCNDLITFSPSKNIDPITYANQLRATGVI